MNRIYLETRFKRNGENDPTFDELESLPHEFAIITAYTYLLTTLAIIKG